MDLLVFDGRARWGDRVMACAVGRGGITSRKREGDGATPVGRLVLRSVYYRPDRIARPSTHLPVAALRPLDGWCDDPGDPAYNRYVSLPYPATHERLWRDDHLYDVMVPLAWNDDPVVPGMGSAIFLHVAAPNYAPTHGCVALALPDLLGVLAEVRPGDAVQVHLAAIAGGPR